MIKANGKKIYSRGQYDHNKDLGHYIRLFTSNTISNTRLKLANNQAKAKQHPQTELEFILPSKTNMRYSKKYAKNKCVYFNKIA